MGRRRRDRSRSPEHGESPHRGRDRRERDVTPVYDSRTGSAHEPAASGSSSYDTNASATERGELLWDRERERIKKKEKEKEIAAKMAIPSGAGKKLTDHLIGKSQD